jgi:hypothetical protein
VPVARDFFTHLSTPWMSTKEPPRR